MNLKPSVSLKRTPARTRQGHPERKLPIARSAKSVLVVDIGGSSVKILCSGQADRRSFRSGPTLNPKRMVAGVKKLAADWTYDVVSIGYPGPVLSGTPIA